MCIRYIDDADGAALLMSGRALQHAKHCLDRQVQHAHLNAFISRASAGQLKNAAKSADEQTSCTLNEH